MRSLSNYDGDVNENAKKSMDLDKRLKTTTLQVHHAFLICTLLNRNCCTTTTWNLQIKFDVFKWTWTQNNHFFIYIYVIYICLDFIQGACQYWVSRRSSPRSHYSPSPPMTELMTSQSLPPSSNSSVMIMSHRIDLAGLGHRKNSLTLHCFLT